MTQEQVTIYSTPTCHFCDQAKTFLKEHDIPFEEHNVADDLEKRQEMVEKSGQMGVPVIVVGNQALVGFDRDTLADALGVSA